MTALHNGIASSDGGIAACFIPRHAMHTVHNGETVDYVICFQCLQIKVIRDGKTDLELTADTPRETFNEFLSTADIPLAAMR